jgi:hypothetical protein
MNAAGKSNAKARTAEASKTGEAAEIKSMTGSGSASADLCGCKWPFSAHRRHPTSNRAGHAFKLSETAPANIEKGRDREKPEHQRGGGFFVAWDSPAFPSRAIL